MSLFMSSVSFFSSLMLFLFLFCIAYVKINLSLLSVSLPPLPVRTGLEAIMETYAFWRPPVRTLTFEDFTNMQKQQGVYMHIISDILLSFL